MKQQTCWTILRHFGYDDKLQLKSSFYDDGTVSNEELSLSKNVELSKEAQVFLERMFESYKSRSGKLEESELERIFATTEMGIPWRVGHETEVEEGGLTLKSWIGLWQKNFSLDPKEAFKSLLYIGYCGKMKDAVTLYRYKLTDALKVSKRKVFKVIVFGTSVILRVLLYFSIPCLT